MNTIDIIRAEIERLKGELIRGACAAQIEMETNCKEEAYNEILFILNCLENATEANEVLMGRVKAPSLDMEAIQRKPDTLQEPEVDLDAEVANFIENERYYPDDEVPLVKEIATYFYELGKNSK